MNVALLTSSVWSRSEGGVTSRASCSLVKKQRRLRPEGGVERPRQAPPCYPVFHWWPTAVREKTQHSLRCVISVPDWQTRGARRRSTRCWSVPMVTRTNRSQLLTEDEDLCGPIKGKHLQMLAHTLRAPARPFTLVRTSIGHAGKSAAFGKKKKKKWRWRQPKYNREVFLFLVTFDLLKSPGEGKVKSPSATLGKSRGQAVSYERICGARVGDLLWSKWGGRAHRSVFFSHILWQPSLVSLLSLRKNMSQTHRHPFKKFELIGGAAVIRYYANARNWVMVACFSKTGQDFIRLQSERIIKKKRERALHW